MQIKHCIKRNYPLGGHGRYFMEWLRPMIIQYFIETDTDGVPINLMYRSVVYQRAKGALDSVPLGTNEALSYVQCIDAQLVRRFKPD